MMGWALITDEGEAICQALSMQQQLLLSLWLSQIAQGYRFSVATPLLCLKQSYYMHISYCEFDQITASNLTAQGYIDRAKSFVLPSSSIRIRIPLI